MALPWDELPTPDKVRSLQRTLYRKAKENGRWRAWSLYGDLCRRDVLATALAAVVGNAGSAGVEPHRPRVGSLLSLRPLHAGVREPATLAERAAARPIGLCFTAAPCAPTPIAKR